MLKTNSKVARENVKSFIKDNFNYEDYEPISMGRYFGGIDGSSGDFSDIAFCIWSVFWDEVGKHQARKTIGTKSSFRYWCQGLPNVLNTSSYYVGTAIDILGDILEETDEERNRYQEADAEELLTSLIYDELLKGREKFYDDLKGK